MRAGWLLAVVATQAVAVSSILVAAHIGQPYRLELTLAALSMWLAFQHAYGPAVSLPVAAVVAAAVSVGLLAYGRGVVAVDDDAFVTGRARLPLWAVGRVEAVAAAEARVAR